MKAEYLESKGCLQRNNAEREEYAGARSIDNRETEKTDGAELLERILDRDNLNRAYKRVKANKGAPGELRRVRRTPQSSPYSAEFAVLRRVRRTPQSSQPAPVPHSTNQKNKNPLAVDIFLSIE